MLFYPTHRLGVPMIVGYARLVHDTVMNFRLSQDYCLWQGTEHNAAKTNFLKILEIQQKRNHFQNNTTEELCKNKFAT